MDNDDNKDTFNNGAGGAGTETAAGPSEVQNGATDPTPSAAGAGSSAAAGNAGADAGAGGAAADQALVDGVTKDNHPQTVLMRHVRDNPNVSDRAHHDAWCTAARDAGWHEPREGHPEGHPWLRDFEQLVDSARLEFLLALSKIREWLADPENAGKLD